MSDSFATSWTVAHQDALSMGFSRQEYWSGLPFPHPGDLPDPAIEPESSASPALASVWVAFSCKAWARATAAHQFEHQEVHGSRIAEAWLGEF